MPKIVNRREIQEEFLEKAFELFARNGYEITIRELANGMGVSTGTLYHYFDKKETLFTETMAYVSKKHVKIIIGNIVPQWDNQKKIQVVVSYILENEEYFQNMVFLTLDYYRQNGSSDPGSVVQNLIQFYKSSLKEQLNLKGEEIPSILFSFLIGLILQRLFDDKSNQDQKQINLFISMLFSIPELKVSKDSFLKDKKKEK